MLSGPATRPKTPLAVENSVGKLAAAEMWRQMPAREREPGELPSPIWSLLDRKVGQGLDAYGLDGWISGLLDYWNGSLLSIVRPPCKDIRGLVILGFPLTLL